MPTLAQEEGANDFRFQTCSGLAGGAEVAFLRPYVGDLQGVSVELLTNSASYRSDSNTFDPSWRLWLGYVSPTGGGVRARYWQFDHDLAAETFDTTVGGDALSGRGRLNMYSIDVEFMQRFDFETFSINGTAGMRVANIDRSFSMTSAGGGGDPSTLSLSNQYDGIGPTLSGEFRRPIGSGGLAVLVNSRGTLLFGSRKVNLVIPEDLAGFPDFPQISITGEDDSFLAVGEIQMGFEWSRELSNGSRVFTNALWEGQAWGSNSSMAGLTGFIVGLGLAR
ncbi:MAG: Lpg1974 family pore-forming outer membrane protein [Thermoguttaceae bacterium]